MNETIQLPEYDFEERPPSYTLNDNSIPITLYYFTNCMFISLFVFLFIFIMIIIFFTS